MNLFSFLTKLLMGKIWSKICLYYLKSQSQGSNMTIDNELTTKLMNIATNQDKFEKNGEFNEILQNLQEIKNESSDTSSAISNATKEANNDAKLFATFDFMQAMNQLLYGNLDDNERSKLLAKMEKIAQSV